MALARPAAGWIARRGPDLPSLLLAGVGMGTLIAASTWDVPTFWGLYLLASVADAWRGSRSGRS